MKSKALAWPLLAVLATLALHGAIAIRHFPGANFQKYQLAARQYNEGKLENERLADFSPLYFHLHAALQQWLPRPERAILWLQVVLVALSAGLLLHLLRGHFPLWVALAGTTAFVLDRGILVYEHIMEPEILILFFLLGSWLLCSRGKGRWHYLLGGFFFALALLCRLNFLLFIVLVPWQIRMLRKERAEWIRTSAVFLLFPLLALGFLGLRNHKILGSVSFLSMNPGTVFFEGNNPNSLGQSSIYPPLVYDLADEFPGHPDPQHMLYRLVARGDSNSELDIQGVNRYWSGKAVNFISDHPWHFLKQLATKANFFFHNFRRHDLATAYWDDQKLARTRIPTVPLAVVSALALVGMLLSLRQWQRFLLAFGLLFSQMAVLLLTYVSARQRLAVYPAFIFFACAATGRIASLAKRSRRIMAAAATAGLALLLLIPSDAMREEEHQWKQFRLSQDLYRSALQHRENGRWASAAMSARMALAAAPWLGDSLRPADLSFAPQGFQGGALAIHETLKDPDFSTRFDRGCLALAAGELDKAHSIFFGLADQRRRFKRDYDQSSQPGFYLAKIALKKSDPATALDLLAKARRSAPGDPEVLALSYVLTGKSEFKDRIARYFGGLDRDFFIGRAYLEMGDARRALPHLSRLGKALPFYRRGQVYLAAALAGSGQEEKGVSTFLAALERRRDPVFLEKEILQAFRQWRDLRPANARSRFFHGQVLRQYGHYAAALAEQLEALELSPGHPLIKREIGHLQDIISASALK